MDITHVSFMLSKLISDHSPLYCKVVKVISKHSFEIVSTQSKVTVKEFWNDCQDDNILSSDEKEKIYLRFQCSFCSEARVHAFAFALKQLCDLNTGLRYKKSTVHDVFVMKTEYFNLNGSIEKELEFKDVGNGLVFKGMWTHEMTDYLRQEGFELIPQVGTKLPAMTQGVEAMKKESIKLWKTSMTHFWVAAVACMSKTMPMGVMLHIDICGAAFNEKAIQIHCGSPISMSMFETFGFDFFPASRLPRRIAYERQGDETFIMKPYRTVAKLRVHNHPDRSPNVAYLQLEPPGYFYAYQLIDGAHNQIKPLDSFIREHPTNQDLYQALSTEVSRFRHEWMIQLPAKTVVVINQDTIVWTMSSKGSTVFDSNLQPVNSSQISNRNGVIDDYVSISKPVHLLPVKLDYKRPVFVKSEGIGFGYAHSRGTYDSLMIIYQVRRQLTGRAPVSVPVLPERGWKRSGKEHQMFANLLNGNISLKNTYYALEFEKVVQNMFRDREFVDNLTVLTKRYPKFLSPHIYASAKDYAELATFPLLSETFDLLTSLSDCARAMRFCVMNISQGSLGNLEKKFFHKLEEISRLAFKGKSGKLLAALLFRQGLVVSNDIIRS